MKNWTDTLRLLLLCISFTTAVYAQPANDACAGAIAIPVGIGSCTSALYTNVAATSVGDPATPSCWASGFSHSVWFSFVATSTDIEISTNFGETLADTEIAVYSGTCGALTQIACQEDVNTLTGLLSNDVVLRGLTVGNTYYIIIDGNGTDIGTFGICAQQTLPLGPTLPTQDCVGAQPLCGLENVVVPNGPGGTGATVEFPTCFGNPGERSSNWYTFTAVTSGTLSFTITPSTVIDYDFAVFDTTDSCPGTQLRCNWIMESGTGTTGLGCTSNQCELPLDVEAGRTYTILVDRYTSASTSGFTLAFDGTTADFSAPAPSFIAPPVCLGATTHFANTTHGNFAYNWNFGDGFTSNLENPTHTYAAAGSYNVTLLLTTAPGGCQNATTQTVTVNPLPTVDAGNPGSVCPAGCLTLGGSTNALGSVGPVAFSNTRDYPIPDNGTTSSYIYTSGVFPATIGASSIASVCINIDHPFDADLDIYLVCPDGTRIRLSTDNGGSGDNYVDTCFSSSAGMAVASGSPPFTGSFTPDDPFSLLNGCNANGIWELSVRDDSPGNIGIIRDWSITFNNNLPAYTWSPITAMTNAGTLSPRVCPAATTVYTLTANTSAGCSASDTVTVTHTNIIRPVLTCGYTTAISVQFDWIALSGATSYTISYQINTGSIINAGNIGNLNTCTINGLLPGDIVTLTVTPIGGAGTCFGPQTLTCATSTCFPPATPTLSTTSPTCAADGSTAITNFNAANSYAFSPSGPTIGTGGTVVGAVLGTSYTLTTTSGGCTSVSSAAFVNSPRLITPAIPTLSTTAPSCTADGFTVITNYNAAYTYDFSPAGPSASAGGNLNGANFGIAYTITATSNGCISGTSAAFTNLMQIAIPPTPILATTPPTCTANGYTTISNPDINTTYTFSPSGPYSNGSGTIYSAVYGTTYTVKATKDGCTSAASAPFTNYPISASTVATPSVTTTAPTCSADGFTTISNYTAANTYNFTPVGPTVGTGGLISGATFGTNYIVTASNNGCISDISASFANSRILSTPATPTLTTTAPSCTADGFTTVTNPDPTVSYLFSPSGPSIAAGGIITGTVFGTTYTVRATKGGCTSPASNTFSNLVRLINPVTPTVATTAPLCGVDGSTIVTNYNSANTYTFSPAGLSVGTGGIISGATFGTSYTVSATIGSCTSMASSAFTNLAGLVVPAIPAIATVAPTCSADGYASVTNYNAANTYTFSPTGPTVGAGGIISGAAFGTTYTVTAANGSCTSAASTTFSNLARLITPATPTITTTAPLCGVDGSTIVTNYNSANIYTFSPAGPSVTTGGIISGAVFGTSYTVSATIGSCTSAASSPFINLVRLAIPATPVLATTAPTCMADGFTSITNYNAANTYVFSPAGPTATAGGTISGAVLGTSYTLTATNGGCISAIATFTNLARLVNLPTPVLNTTAATCAANSFTTITNYDPTYTYTFSPAGPIAGLGGTVTGTTIGSAYTVIATSGICTSTASAPFTDLARLTTPASPIISTTVPTCTGDGFSAITNYNAGNTYVFSPLGPIVGSGGSISSALTGTSYTVTASNGSCTSPASLAFVNQPRLVTPIVPIVSTTPPTCTADGFTSITNYNSANTYSFLPTGPVVSSGGTISGIVLGTAYMLTASNGSCTSAASSAFTNLTRLATPITPIISTSAPTCTGDGFSAIVNYNAGNTYVFSPLGPVVGSGGSISSALTGTSYTVTASNGSCTSPASLSFVNQPRLATPSVSTLSTTAPTCTADGFTSITNYNSANTYSFSPTGPIVGSGGSISGAVLGTAYTVTATSGSCTSSASAAFSNLARLATPVVPIISTTAPTCTGDGFSAIVNYNAGNTYVFSSLGPIVGSGGSISSALTGTSYTVTASNGSCTSPASLAFVNQPRLATPSVPTLSTTAPTCTADGFTSITNYNSVNTYTFSPAGPVAGTTGAISGATAGTVYAITAGNGSCTSSAAMFSNAPRLFNVTAPNLQPYRICDDNNDGYGLFDLTLLIPTITGGNPYLVSFHETPEDAAINGTTIPDPGAYRSIDRNSQIIYVRVQSNVSSCYVVVPLQLIVNPVPDAHPPRDYHKCDDNYDGLASFNLTNITSEVLGSIDPVTHSVSYYDNLGSAQSGIGALGNLTAFPSSGQTIWIRVETAATGCFDIVTLQLIVEPLPRAIQPNYPPYSTCDRTLPMGYEEFNLGRMIPTIQSNQTGVNVTFHLNQADAQAGRNPLPLLYTNVRQYVQTLWIRLENTSGCIVVSTIDIRVEPLPTPIPPNHAYSICGNNQSGFGIFDLNTLTNDILQGANYTISYHDTYDDAQLGLHPLANPYENTVPFSQTIYALAVDNNNGCRAVIPIVLEVKPRPMTPFNVSPLIKCDQDALPQNGSTTFDLTQNNAALLSIQPLAPSNYTITYHVLQSDAVDGIHPIFQATAYPGTQHEIIWVRIEDNATGCFSVGSFELLINAPLALTAPAALNLCDADAHPNDLFTEFDLTVKNNEITGGQSNMQLIYYPSFPITASSIPISDPRAYTNDPAHPAVQTLGVKVITPQGCVSYTTLDIRVLPIPTPNVNAITPLPPKCDVNNTGDMMELFDLTANAAAIINRDPTLVLHYYPTQNDALAQTHEILTPNAALVGHNVWIRVENNQVDYLNHNCFVLLEQPLTVYPLPATIPVVTVQNCDDDTDGHVPFNLTAVTAAFYANANVTISYHMSAADAQSGNNPITNPNAYPNTSNPQTIYIRVVDNVTGCANYNGQLTLQVNPKPTAAVPADFETCDTDGTNDGFFALDLNSYTNAIIGAQTGVTATFFNNQNDAANNLHPIANPAAYHTYTHTIWVRVENTTTGCFALLSFKNTVEKLAEPIITAPTDVLCTEYGTNILLNSLTLNSGITNPNYTFEWFESSNPATVLGTNPTYTITAVAPGNYTVVATSINPPLLHCASDPSSAFTVLLGGPPQFASPPYTVSNYFDENQIITVNVVGNGQYEFSLDDGPFQTSNVFTNVALGSHSVTVRDATGQTSCGEIFFDGIQTINYPHYFTPNGDGINDTWNIVGLNQSGARLYIFDRYGKLLKQLSATADSPGWDGTFNGHMLPADDYWFKIEYLEVSQRKEFKAHFTLKR